MSNPSSFTRRQQTFKQVDVGQKVVLNDEYLLEHHRSLQLEAIALRTMQHAEEEAVKLIENARREAQEILEAARGKARQIVEEEGHQQREAIRQKAYEEGFEAGRREGHMQMAQEAAEKLKLADLIVEKAFEAETTIIAQQKAQLANVLQYVLKLILTYEIQSQPEQIAGLIQKAAEQIQFTGTAKLIIHPETLQTIRHFAPDTMKALADMQRIAFHADAGCAPDELYLETLDSVFCISPESQAEIYMDALKKHITLPDIVEQAADIQASGQAPPAKALPPKPSPIRGKLVPAEESQTEDPTPADLPSTAPEEPQV